jgi:hypothetical protein
MTDVNINLADHLPEHVLRSIEERHSAGMTPYILRMVHGTVKVVDPEDLSRPRYRGYRSGADPWASWYYRRYEIARGSGVERWEVSSLGFRSLESAKMYIDRRIDRSRAP